MDRVYPSRINWQNLPSTATPINEINLNKLDYAVYEIDGRVVELDTTKANQSDLLQTTNEVTDARTGADGVTYPNLGTSIRTQINYADTRALTWNIDDLSFNGFLNANYNLVISQNWKTTDYQNIERIERIYAYVVNNQSTGYIIAFYNTSKAGINRTVINASDVGENSITVPVNARYIRISAFSTNPMAVYVKNEDIFNALLDTPHIERFVGTSLANCRKFGYYATTNSGSASITDKPNNVNLTAMMFCYPYAFEGGYTLQIYYDFYGNAYRRILSTDNGNVVSGWIPINSKKLGSGVRVVAIGDSIMYGRNNDGTGIADYIADKYALTKNDYSVSGATVADSSNTLLDQLDTLMNASITPDIILIDGGTNDIYQGYSLGEINTSINDDTRNNKNTFSGALQHIFLTLKNAFPNALILFIRVHKIGGKTSIIPIEAQKEYGERALDICELYGISYIDIYKTFSSELSIDYNTFTSDGIHPVREGYLQKYMPQIYSKIEEMYYRFV